MTRATATSATTAISATTAWGAAALAGLALATLELAVRLPRLLEAPGSQAGLAALTVIGLVLAFALLVGTPAALLAARAPGLAHGLAVHLRRPLPTALLALATLLLVVFSLTIMPDAYNRLHLPADAVLVLTGQALLLSRGRPQGRGWLLTAPAALATVALACALGQSPGVSAVRRYGLVSNRVALAVDWLADRDGDGYPAAWWLGGVDCDDRDRGRGPHAPEIPGNGVDDNCVGGDLPLADAAPSASPRPAVPPARHLLLLSVCTFRALPIEGTGPEFPELRARALVAARNRSQAPDSYHSFHSALSSRLPHEVMTDEALAPRLESPETPLLLMDRLSAAGFRTAFAHHGLERTSWPGLRRFDADTTEDDLAGFARRWLGKGGEQRSALWFHLNYTHATGNEYRPQLLFHRPRLDAYLANRERSQRTIAALLEGLEADGRLADTAVILFADHGEAFGEHGVYFHGRALYEEMIRTPLMVAAPGLAPGTLAVNTSNLDVVPTALDLLGLPLPADLRGESLLRLPRAGADRPVVSELFFGHQLRGRTAISGDGRWKLVLGFDPPTRHLHDLVADPEERRNLWGQHPEVVTRLLPILDQGWVRPR